MTRGVFLLSQTEIIAMHIGDMCVPGKFHDCFSPLVSRLDQPAQRVYPASDSSFLFPEEGLPTEKWDACRIRDVQVQYPKRIYPLRSGMPAGFETCTCKVGQGKQAQKELARRNARSD